MRTTSLDHSTARAAVALANLAPSVHNSQPWRWRIGDESIHLFADTSRALPATDPEGRDLRISCGAALHHLRVALLAAGLGSRVRRIPDPAHPQHLAAVEPHRARPTPEDLALAHALETRRSDRRAFSTWPVPPGFLDELVSAARKQSADLHVLGSAHRALVARLVEQAAVEQALTPGLAQEVARWTGAARGAREGVPAANVPRQQDATVPTRHFAGAEQDPAELGTEEADGTVVALLSTASDDPVDQLVAGEALSAVLLTATRFGLATDPISQPLEVPGQRARLRAEVLADAAEPQILLRLGWAPISAAPVPRTGRRPLSDTVDPMDRPLPPDQP